MKTTNLLVKKKSFLSQPGVSNGDEALATSFYRPSAYEGGGQSRSWLRRLIFPLTCVSVLIIAELARACTWSRNLEPNFCADQDLNPGPHD